MYHLHLKAHCEYVPAAKDSPFFSLFLKVILYELKKTSQPKKLSGENYEDKSLDYMASA